jgi:hypothetical protein
MTHVYVVAYLNSYALFRIIKQDSLPTYLQLRTLTSALSPMHLRIGGSEGDLVVYNVEGGECDAVNATFCLTMDRWDDLHDFAQATGGTIAFGLDAMAGRANMTSYMNLTNLASFVSVTVGLLWWRIVRSLASPIVCTNFLDQLHREQRL